MPLIFIAALYGALEGKKTPSAPCQEQTGTIIPPNFMHPDAAPAPDARRAKKPPSHSGWWGMLRLRRAKRRIERTEKQDTKDWRRTYLTGRRKRLQSICFDAIAG